MQEIIQQVGTLLLGSIPTVLLFITLAEQTGGKSFYVSNGGLDKAFARVSDDLRTQYLIGYYPQHQEPGRAFHRVLVTIPRAAAENFNIRHKTGYYVDSPVNASK